MSVSSRLVSSLSHTAGSTSASPIRLSRRRRSSFVMTYSHHSLLPFKALPFGHERTYITGVSFVRSIFVSRSNRTFSVLAAATCGVAGSSANDDGFVLHLRSPQEVVSNGYRLRRCRHQHG